MPGTISLDVIDVARPCPSDWDAMSGDNQVLFCGHCKLNLFNLSAMTREAAEQLIAEKEGNLCGRFYRRADGTIITADCGWKLRAQRIRALAGFAVAAVMAGILAPFGFSRDELLSGRVMDSAPPARLIERVVLKLQGTPPPPAVAGGIAAMPPMGLIAPKATMGDVALPSE